MVDAPDDEVVALLAGGPADFVATRTARARVLRSEGRREEAAALAAVRKPLRLVWALVEVQRAAPDLVAGAVAAAEALAAAQAGGGGRVRPLVAELRTALQELGAVAEGAQAAEVGLAARQVLGDPEARSAWAGGRLLALPAPDTEGGRTAGGRGAAADDHGTTAPSTASPRRTAKPKPPTAPTARPSRTARATARDTAGEEAETRTRAEAEAEAAAREEAARAAERRAVRIREAEGSRDAAAEELARARDAAEVRAAALEDAREAHERALAAVAAAESALVTQEEAVAAAKEEGGDHP